MTAGAVFAGPFSFNHFCRSPWYGATTDLPAAIEACARAGFELFAPDCLSLGEWLAAGRSLDDLTRQMRDAGIAIGPLAACAMLDGSARASDQLAAAARMAEALGTRLLQVNVTGPSAKARADAVEAACAMLAPMGAFRLALEYLPFSGLSTLAESLKIVARVGEAQAGALVDIWHHSHDPSGWEVLASAPLDAIAYVEISDALAPIGPDLMAETMDRRTYPGAGMLETGRFADLLLRRGYQGPISVEILSRRLQSEPIAAFASQALANSRTLFRAV